MAKTKTKQAPRILDHGDTFTHKGHMFRVKLIPDTDHKAPWDDGDGRGIVTDWVRREKGPGERILNSDRGSYRYFDWQGTVQRAIKEGWDAEPYGQGTKRQQAERATEAEYRRLKAWCDDQWWYVGVLVTLLDADGDKTPYESGGLWGVESDSGDYIAQIAKEEADQLLHDLPKRLDGHIKRLQELRRKIG